MPSTDLDVKTPERESIPRFDDRAVFFAPEPFVTVFGVKYLHLRMENGSDLYITEHGLPFTNCLLPKNHWDDEDWRRRKSVRLNGTSVLYRLPTKEVNGRSIDLVIKWNRMGQDIPGETRPDAEGLEFNSPFMEFSLVLELRKAARASAVKLHTHRPLAIYVPRKYVEAERLGRRQYKKDAILKSHGEIDLDWNRNYAVIYDWLKGIDATQAHRKRLIDTSEINRLVDRANAGLQRNGYRVRDSKPQHIIVRPDESGSLVRDSFGETLFGLIDFELLERTSEREKAIRAVQRREYLFRQAHRFEPREEFPPGLSQVNILGVDYVYGKAESTGGSLWVVGRDPMLFDYFLPEKWRRTPRTKLSTSQQVYKTVTKDNVHLVWRVSRVGQRPDADPFLRSEKRILAHGNNSPFEEFSIAMELSGDGIETVYPRAIYMSGHRLDISTNLVDRRRYDSHADLLTPAGHPILSDHHEYITIWGYWNGPDDVLAVKDEVVYRGIDALTAYWEGRITQRQYLKIMRTTRNRLAAAGVEDLSLRGNHILLSINQADEQLAVDRQGAPLVRICNFELLKRMA